jgi:glycosyltransferase involved in cell wall biosynthesis
VGVYLQGCLPYFLAAPHEFVLLGDSPVLRSLVPERKGLTRIPCGVKPFSPAELCAFPRGILRALNRADLYYSPSFNLPAGIRVPVYTTMHDIIFPDMPELASKIGLAARMWWYRRAFRRSEKVFTVSQFSKSRIERFLGTSAPVIVTYSAVQNALAAGGPAPACAKKETILFIGNIKKHKGLGCLLDGFFRARSEGLGHTLIIVGDKDNFRSSDTAFLRSLRRMDRSILEFTGHAPPERLRALIAEAALLVQPSLYEGFGLPPLEAMTGGTAALISDIPAFKEIYGDFPVTFFRAGDPADLKEKLLALLRGKGAPSVTLSPELACRYSFQKTASAILHNLAAPAACAPAGLGV